MEAEQARIQADLRGILDGEVFCDPLHSQMYASDASLYQIAPIAVVRPRHSDDVAGCIKYAVENSLPVFPRGGGTGLAGQSLGPGIVLDFSRFMRRMLEVDTQGLQVRVQPGITLGDLNRQLAQHRLVLGIDPPMRAVTTVGSLIAIDALGSHYPRYGTAGSHVLKARAVLDDGEQVQLAKTSWHYPSTGSQRLDRIATELGRFLTEHKDTIQSPPWKGIPRGCGYRLESVLEDDQIDLARLQSGAEGTLTVLTELTLKVDRIPNARALVLLFFEKLELAARAALEARKDEVAACDLMDRRLIEIARELDPGYEAMLPRGAEALLLIEHQGQELSEVKQRLNGLVQRIVRKAPSTQQTHIIVDDAERDFVWRLSRRIVPQLVRLGGPQKPISFVDDLSIQPERMPEFLFEVQNILKSERVTATLFAHAAQGNVQLKPFLDPNSEEYPQKLQRIADKIVEKVIEFRGVISGEHAVGLSRSSYLRQQLGELYPICRQIKNWFDPQGILNPGKLITDSPQRPIDNLRTSLLASEPSQSQQPSRPMLPILDWSGENSLQATSSQCNGCGRCRTNAPGERMCPLFRATRSEEASPRAKANLIRGLITGEIPAAQSESDQMRSIADLCFHCHQCRFECPAQVDIPRMVVELKAQHTATNGLRMTDRLLSRIDLLTSLASRFPRLANWALGNRSMRWILEKSTGIAMGRRLPQIAKQSFMKWAAKQKLNRMSRAGGRKVLYLVDQYANWHNPWVGRALVEVMKHQRVDVYVPTWQTVTWMTKITLGDVQRVGRMIAPQLRRLADAVRQGYTIVATEPTAALCLQHEYPNLFPSDDASLVASNTQEAGSYLWDMHNRNELELDFKPLSMSIIYHTPCHLRALDPNYNGIKLLELIPGLNVVHAEAGCSGMAGVYGLKRDNYRTSLRVGWGLISTMQKTQAQIGSTECASCKLQMEQGVDKPTIPPIALMAYAYGRLPEVKTWIQARHDSLVVP
ncbi:MAG: FAD-binding protein [Planctomycetaceae bacterium]|nr:FAD-binding protein [Planctomycetaceae bacterium]